jgi:curved DNA-binding protein CbpA
VDLSVCGIGGVRTNTIVKMLFNRASVWLWLVLLLVATLLSTPDHWVECAHVSKKLPKLTTAKTYYDVLQVPKHAGEDAIKKSYRRLAKLYHPDKNRDDPEEAQQQFVVLSKAYETLSDQRLRADYDHSLRFGGSGDGQQQQQQQQQHARFGRSSQRHFTAEDILRSFHSQHHQQQQQQEEQEETIYMFQGSDGRTYYRRERTPRRHFQQEPFSALPYLYSFLQLLFVVLVLNALFKCFGIDPMVLPPQPAPQRPAAAVSPADQPQQQPSAPPPQRPASSSSLPTLSTANLCRKSVVVVVALNARSERALLANKRHFRNDPLLFTSALALGNKSDDQVRSLLQTLLSGTGHAAVLEEIVRDDHLLCFVALYKSCTKYAVMIDTAEAVKMMPGATAALNTSTSSPSTCSLPDVSVAQQWLEKVVEGRLTWLPTGVDVHDL